MNSAVLKNNNEYNLMKKAIKNFFESSESLNVQSYVSILYRSLVSMMIQISQIKDLSLAARNNNKLFAWFDEKRRKLMGLPPTRGHHETSSNGDDLILAKSNLPKTLLSGSKSLVSLVHTQDA